MVTSARRDALAWCPAVCLFVGLNLKLASSLRKVAKSGVGRHAWPGQVDRPALTVWDPAKSVYRPSLAAAGCKRSTCLPTEAHQPGIRQAVTRPVSDRSPIAWGRTWREPRVQPKPHGSRRAYQSGMQWRSAGQQTALVFGPANFATMSPTRRCRCPQSSTFPEA